MGRRVKREPWDGPTFERMTVTTTRNKSGKVVDLKHERKVFSCSATPKKVTKGIRRQLVKVARQNPAEADRQRALLG